MTKPNFDLNGKNIFISGSYGYLGSVLAKGLAAQGAHVILNGRNGAKLEALAREISEKGQTASLACFDVTDFKAVEDFFKDLKGPLHGLINNAYSGKAGTIELINTNEFDEALNVNITAPFHLMQAALPSLKKGAREAHDAAIINISSMYGSVAPDLTIYSSPQEANAPYYGASKAALLQLTRYAASEFGKYGVRVNSVSPGPFPQEGVQKSNPEFISRLSRKTILGRIGEAQELVGPVSFLLSPAASYVTGANLAVDGGWTAL